MESGFGLGPGSAGLGRVREGWRPRLALGLCGLVALSLGRLASNRWRGRSKQAKDETRG